MEGFVNTDTLFVVDRGRSFALRRFPDSDAVIEAGTREELDVWLAVMGLEVDWSSKSDTYSIWPVRELRR